MKSKLLNQIGKKTKNKLNKNITSIFLKSYFLNKFRKDTTLNDLGASFTTIKRVGKRIVKRADLKGEAKLKKEIEWNLKFKKKTLGRYLPQIYRFSIKKKDTFFEMKYYDFPSLRKIIIDQLSISFFDKMRWCHLFKILNKHLYTEENSIKCVKKHYFENMHLKKLRVRNEEVKKSADFLRPMMDENMIKINGKEYLNATIILKAIQKDKDIIDLLTPERLYFSHGDIHCNNILCGFLPFNFILLDCRGSSPDGSIYFDVAYDVAKLYHDLRSFYSLVERDLYEIKFFNKNKKVEIKYQFINPDLVSCFEKHFKYVEKLVKKKLIYFGNIEYRASFIEASLFFKYDSFSLEEKIRGDDVSYDWDYSS